MKKFVKMYLDTFYGKDVELRVKLFHVLATTGFIICVIMTAVSIAGDMPISAMINIGAGLVSLFLLLFSARKGHYRFCYWVTIIVIFFILFPSLFFSGGGYSGGMPFFFVFAAVFTVYMLDGWGMLIVTLAELAFYIMICIAAFKHPEWVVPFDSEMATLTDIIIGLVTVSISLGATMFVQIRMYQKQQRNLVNAQKGAEAANKAKSAFLANMSHEIRTPIHMILGMNEIVLRETKSKQVKEYSEKIDETSKMLLSLIDSILDVSKIESGKMELIPAPYESANLIKMLALIGRTNCEKKKLRFLFHVSDDLPKMLLGDLAHIRQIAANFLNNAAKYTKTGSITLTVFQEPGENEEQILLGISVEDTGAGISKEDIPTLFDAFARADVASHRYVSGAGLGLSIVKELTTMMNGKIFVDSELGKGTKFTVKIPQKVLKDEQLTVEEKPMTFHAPEVHMLVVDDNEGNRTVMRELLAPTKIKIDTAESGAECLRMVEENEYHLILMDYMMPEMDGLETMGHLLQLKGFHTPVIALTADATSETEKKLLNGGFSAYLSKPIPWKKLRDILLSYIPKEMVTIVTVSEEESAEKPNYEKIEKKLLPYGIMIEDALGYFGNSLDEYGRVAELFLRHDEAEREKVKKFWKEKDIEQLRFPVHALKGKSKNLGLNRVSEVSAYMENLCVKGNEKEINGLMPYLLYLWETGTEGLYVLIKELKITEKETVPIKCACDEELIKLLREFRRRPSLICVKKMIQEETSEEAVEKLQKVAKLINEISFEQAENEFEAYLEWKKGEQ